MRFADIFADGTVARPGIFDGVIWNLANTVAENTPPHKKSRGVIDTVTVTTYHNDVHLS